MAKTKKVKKSVSSGVMCVKASANNIIVTITKVNGDVLAISSAGACGFKGSKKSTPYAAQVVAQKACTVVKGFGMTEIRIKLKGPGPGRDAAAKTAANFFKVTSISDVTGVPHGGCRGENERRV